MTPYFDQAPLTAKQRTIKSCFQLFILVLTSAVVFDKDPSKMTLAFSVLGFSLVSVFFQIATFSYYLIISPRTDHETISRAATDCTLAFVVVPLTSIPYQLGFLPILEPFYSNYIVGFLVYLGVLRTLEGLLWRLIYRKLCYS